MGYTDNNNIKNPKIKKLMIRYYFFLDKKIIIQYSKQQ